MFFKDCSEQAQSIYQTTAFKNSVIKGQFHQFGVKHKRKKQGHFIHKDIFQKLQKNCFPFLTLRLPEMLVTFDLRQTDIKMFSLLNQHFSKFTKNSRSFWSLRLPTTLVKLDLKLEKCMNTKFFKCFAEQQTLESTFYLSNFENRICLNILRIISFVQVHVVVYRKN